MLQLHQFAPLNDKNISPFCLKVETYCQLANIPYQTVASLPAQAPRGKLPYIVDQGNTIADSGLIIDYLKKTYDDPLDAALTDSQRAQGHLLQRTCEESLAHVLVYSRWLDENSWQVVKKVFFANMPFVLRNIVPTMVQRNIRKALYAQGYGRHTQDEIYALGAGDLTALATCLRNTPFAVSNQPTSFDATLYAFLANIVEDALNTPLTLSTRQHPVFQEYIGRMRTHLHTTA